MMNRRPILQAVGSFLGRNERIQIKHAADESAKIHLNSPGPNFLIRADFRELSKNVEYAEVGQQIEIVDTAKAMIDDIGHMHLVRPHPVGRMNVAHGGKNTQEIRVVERSHDVHIVGGHRRTMESAGYTANYYEIHLMVMEPFQNLVELDHE